MQLALASVSNMKSLEERAANARALLRRPTLRLLGAGQEGVVLTDEVETYKLFDRWPEERRHDLQRTLLQWVGRFDGCKHLRPLVAVREIAEVPLLVQRFATSVPWEGGHRDGVIGFLRECLREGVAYDCFNPSNFRVIDGVLQLIDYGADLRPFSWNAWVYMARRAWLSLRHAHRPDLKLALRATITDWETPELDGFEEFLSEALDAASVAETISCNEPSVETTLAFADDVTLLIKVCYQEGDTLLEMVRHLVRQLERPHRFVERRVVLDSRRDGYPRQYTAPAPEAAHVALERLLREGTVDRIDVAPLDEKTVAEVNQRWFGLAVAHPAANSGVPVAPQLWAFDRVPTRYVLQVDADAMVARRDREHDYLFEMKNALLEHHDAVSVGFQIAHEPGWTAAYDAPAGMYCPEVRCGLIDLERLRAMRPLPNDEREGRLTLTWYRSVERALAARGLRSLRGGDGRSFYVHPPNTRKADRMAWFDAMNQIELGRVPAAQFGRVDLTPDPSAWCQPELRHEHVFVLIVDEASRAQFRRLWASIEAQLRRDWCAVIIDSTFDPSVEDVARRHPERVALVRNPMVPGHLSVFHAIELHVREPAAWLIPLRADDELVGGAALTMLRRRTIRGAFAVDAPVLVDGRLVCERVATRLDALDLAPQRDLDGAFEALFGGACESADRAPGPMLVRGRARATRSSAMTRVPPRTLHRPSPIGELVRSSPWREGADSVLFVRHAEKVDGSRFCTVEENRARGLSLDGFDESVALGRALSPSPDLVLCSPVVRARETADAIVRGAGGAGSVIECEALLGGRFDDHERWLSMKRELGWERLIERWLRGEVSEQVVTPAAVAIPALLEAVATHSRRAKRVVVVTQGHVNTAVFQRCAGVIDFSGGPLFGFWVARDNPMWRMT